MNNSNHFRLTHYLLLIFIVLAGVFLFFYFSGNPTYQFTTSIIISSCYFLWGIYHHKAEGDLHPKIMIEYLLIAILAVLLIRGAIYR